MFYGQKKGRVMGAQRAKEREVVQDIGVRKGPSTWDHVKECMFYSKWYREPLKGF